MKFEFKGLELFGIIITRRKSIENMSVELDNKDVLLIIDEIKKKYK